jgi:hypothetical protein
MANIDRRTFLRATTAIAAGAVAPDLTLATDNNNKELMASPSPATPHVTKTLASYIVSARYEDLPDNGLFAAVLASKNFTSSDQMIEAKRGWANTISTKEDYKEITEGLGERYEALLKLTNLSRAEL